MELQCSRGYWKRDSELHKAKKTFGAVAAVTTGAQFCGPYNFNTNAFCNDAQGSIRQSSGGNGPFVGFFCR